MTGVQTCALPISRSYLQHIRRLQLLVDQLPTPDIPVPKLKQYRYIARSLDATEMAELKPQKRYALAVIYIRSQFAQTLDDAADLFVRMLQNLDNQARNKLGEYQQEHLQRTDRLIGQLKEMLLAYQIDGTDHQRVEAIGGSLIAEVDDLVAICDEHMAYAGRNHLPFLIQPYKMVRAQLLNCIEIVNPQSSSEDDTLMRMMKALQVLRGTRHEIVPLSLVGLNADEDFLWLPTTWRKLVITERADGQVVAINRRYFELAVLYAIRDELKSGDLFIQHGERYDDYREQLVDDDGPAELGDLGHAERDAFDAKRAGLQLGHVEQIADEVVQPLGFLLDGQGQVRTDDGRRIIVCVVFAHQAGRDVDAHHLRGRLVDVLHE